jgi:hypothetical protein
MENFTLVELATYHPHLLTHDKMIDLLAELDAWRELDDTPASVAARLSDAEDKVHDCERDHSDYDALKSFFDDVVSTMEEFGVCPGVEPSSVWFREAVMEYITKGEEACEVESFNARMEGK